MKIKITDNFLSKEEFTKLQSFIMSDMMPWYFNDFIVDRNKTEGLSNYQFTHTFYKEFQVWSPNFSLLANLISQLKVKSLVRIKLNLSHRTDTNIKSSFHCDTAFDCITSILYINTNNGYTEFENGEKIDSVENKLVTFPSNMKHLGTTCTNQKRRIVLNINYF